MINDYNIYTANLLRTLHPALKQDKRIYALAQVIAEEKSKTLGLIKENIIYARIDELSEEVLDILAHDLHVDWYDYNHPIEAKRATIKNSIKVHIKLGTVEGVSIALGALYPESECEEWDRYDGRPFYFRIILDITNSVVTAAHSEIVKEVNFYKPKRSRLEESPYGIIYRTRGRLQIRTASGSVRFTSGMTGQRIAGTHPKRSTIGKVEKSTLGLMADADGQEFSSPLAGTYPERSTIGQIEESALEIAANTSGQEFSSPLAGTVPVISTSGEIECAGMTMELTGQSAAFKTKLCGTAPGSL